MGGCANEGIIWLRESANRWEMPGGMRLLADREESACADLLFGGRGRFYGA